LRRKVSQKTLDTLKKICIPVSTSPVKKRAYQFYYGCTYITAKLGYLKQEQSSYLSLFLKLTGLILAVLSGFSHAVLVKLLVGA
jgi:hypothetical protein